MCYAKHIFSRPIKNITKINPKTSSSKSQSSSKPESESINIPKPLHLEPHNKTPTEKNYPNSDSPPEKPASFDDSLDDFASPIVIRKRNVIPQLKVNAKPSVKPKPKTTSKRTTNNNKRKPTKNYTIKIIEENFNVDGANPDHLQLAIALSKSTYEAERGQMSSECKEECPDVGEILQNVKPTSLERFGFKAGKAATMPVANRKVRTGLSELSKRAKSRFKYVTPILKIRTTEDRESLISSKILQILGQSSIKSKVPSQNSVVSHKLQDFIPNKIQSIFQTDEIYTNKYFYIDALKLPKSSHKCRGCLLKDMSSILGRDKSPTRQTDTATHNNTTVDNVDTKTEDSLAHIKIVSDACIVKPSTSFSLHTNHERMSKSWTSDTKDSGITGWSRDTFSSVSSSYRGVSPDLFGSDEEECYSNRTVEFGSINPNILDLETSGTLDKTVPVKESDDKPNSSKIEMDPNNSDRQKDVVDLTDDDDIEPQNKNHSSSFTRLASFYSLDEFEEDFNSDSAKEPNLDEEDLILNGEVAEIIEPSVNKDIEDVRCASLSEMIMPEANSISSAVDNRSSYGESKKSTYTNRGKSDKKKSPGHSLEQSPKKVRLCKTLSCLSAEKNPTTVKSTSKTGEYGDGVAILDDSLLDQYVRHEDTSRPSPTSSNRSQHSEKNQNVCLNSSSSKGFDLIQQITNTNQRKIYPSQSPSNRSTVDHTSPNYSKGFEDWEPEDYHFDEIAISSPGLSCSFALNNSVNNTDLKDVEHLDRESSLGSPGSPEQQRSDDFKAHNILKENLSDKNEISCIEILDDSLLESSKNTSRPASRSSNRSELNNQDGSLSKSGSIASDFDLFEKGTDNAKIQNSDSQSHSNRSSMHHRSPNCTEVFDDWVPEDHVFEDIDVLSPSSNGSIEHTDSEKIRTDDVESTEQYNQKTNLDSAKLEREISSKDRSTWSHSNRLSVNHRSPNCSEVFDDWDSVDHHLEDMDAPSTGMTSSFTHRDPDKNRTDGLKSAEHSNQKANIDSSKMGSRSSPEVPRIDDPLKSPLLKVNTSYKNADDCIELSDDSLTDHHFETLPTVSPAFDGDFEEKSSTKHCAKSDSRSIVKEIADGNIEHTPKRSIGCNSSTSIKRTERKELLGYVGMSTNRLSSFGISRGYNSTDLNVTDYVHDLLSREQFSFDHCNEEEANEDIMALSQESCSSVLADDELNYSSHFATPGTRKTENRIIPDSGDVFMEEDLSDGLDGLSDVKKNSPPHTNASSPLKQPLGTVEPTIAASKYLSTPEDYVIKTQNVTPMPDYDNMTTPLVKKELQKLGVKPLKRARGATLLKYIYESTHPLAAGSVDVAHQHADDDPDEGARVIKRRKWSNEQISSSSSANKGRSVGGVVDVAVVAYVDQSASSIDIVGDRLIENEKPEDLLFERRQSVKIPSCRVPLQIIWHNFLSCNPTIRENILLYEPLQLESLHTMLKELGYKFHVQDLLTYLDKKCITIRTAQKQGKRHR